MFKHPMSADVHKRRRCIVFSAGKT